MYIQTLGASTWETPRMQADLEKFENALDETDNDLGAAIRKAGNRALVAYLVDQDRSPVEYAAMLTAATGRGYTVNDVLMLYRDNGYEDYLTEVMKIYGGDIAPYLYEGFPKIVNGQLLYSPQQEAALYAGVANPTDSRLFTTVYEEPTVEQIVVTPEVFEEMQGGPVPVIMEAGNVAVPEFTQKELEKMALDARYAFFSVELVENKTPEEKAAYFNFLRSQGFTEAGIFEAIEYWMGPQRPEDLQALKTLAEQLRTGDGPNLNNTGGPNLIISETGEIFDYQFSNIPVTLGQIYVMTFGRIPDTTGLKYWKGVVGGDLDLKEYEDFVYAGRLNGETVNEENVQIIRDLITGPILTDARDFPRGPDTGPGSPLREPVFGQAAGGGNTGLLIAAALAALTLLG